MDSCQKSCVHEQKVVLKDVSWLERAMIDACCSIFSRCAKLYNVVSAESKRRGLDSCERNGTVEGRRL